MGYNPNIPHLEVGEIYHTQFTIHFVAVVVVISSKANR